jgi:hypothetical protein
MLRYSIFDEPESLNHQKNKTTVNSHFNHLKHPDGQSTGLLKKQPGFPVSDPKQSSEVYSFSGQGLNHDLNRNLVQRRKGAKYRIGCLMIQSSLGSLHDGFLLLAVRFSKLNEEIVWINKAQSITIYKRMFFLAELEVD